MQLSPIYRISISDQVVFRFIFESKQNPYVFVVVVIVLSSSGRGEVSNFPVQMNRYLRKTLALGGQLAKYFCVAHCTFTYVGNLVLVSLLERR